MEKLVLIDGHSILHRAFHGVPELTNAQGIHTNAVFGFLNIMFRILDEEKPDHLAVAFDLGEPTFRHKLYKEYKANRSPMPPELLEQVDLIKEGLTAMGVLILTCPGFEADDILGTVAKKMQEKGVEVCIISGDKDLLQIADKQIKIRIPKTSRGVTQVYDYYPEDVKKEYKVSPEAFIDVKALMGDTSDNIPGVPSIGIKTATAIISAYGSIENAYAHVEEITPPKARKALKEHYEQAKLSKELATICIDCGVSFSYPDAEIGSLYTDEAYQFLEKMEFKSFLSRFNARSTKEVNLTEDFLITDQKKIAEEWIEQAKIQVSGADKEESDLEQAVGLQLFIGQGDEQEEQISFHFGEGGELEIGGKAEEDRQVVAGMSLSLGDKKTVCIRTGKEIEEQWILDCAREIIQEAKQGLVWVLDLKKLLPHLNLDYGASVLDGGVAGYLLNPLKDTYGYDDLARDYLRIILPSEKDLLGKIPVGKALLSGDEKAGICACYHAYTVQKAAKVLKEKLENTQMWQLFLTMEMPLIYSLFHMEQAGIKVKRTALKEYGDKLKIKISALEKQIYAECGEVFNINSPKQLGEILFEKMQLPGGKKTKTGYSTAAEVLEKLAPEVPVVQRILDYRQLTKLNSTYAEGLSAYIRSDERIHGTFNQTITATGRISSTEPNLQNIPVRVELGREIRKVFVPEDGYIFIDADYSQIELRILASLSNDERLIEAYGLAQDIHAITASHVFHIPLSEVNALQRRNAKAVNFGIVYGISAFGLGEGLSISKKEAQDYIDQYFETYPGVKEYLDKLVAEGREKGYVTTLYGRRRPVPELKSGNFSQRAFGERVAMNSPVQGTAADIMKIAMIGVDQELRRRNLKSRIVLQVHDELLVEAWKEEASLVKEILEDKMKHASSLKVALEVEAKEGDSWFAAK